MSTNNKISSHVENQFPFYTRGDAVDTSGANFITFVKAYYEWLEQANNAIEVSRNLLNYQDIDNTYDRYLEYFHREIMGSIPRKTLTDRKLLAKHIKDIYRSRGSEISYRLLFRILYNEEIEFYYPGEDILRASDGRWTQRVSVKIAKPRVGSFNLGDSITGIISGATATVDEIYPIIETGVPVDEIYITSLDGVFQDGELVKNSSNTVNATIYGTTGPMQAVTVTTGGGGVGHLVGDTVSLTGSGSGATGTVTSITNRSALNFTITNGGSGYQTNAVVTISTGGSGVGAAFTVSAISDTEVIFINTDTITGMRNVVINTGPVFPSLGANSATLSANLAIANVSTALNKALNFDQETVGTISAISISSRGRNYGDGLPTILIRQPRIEALAISDAVKGGFKGNNAIITPSYATGTIRSIDIVLNGAGYIKGSTVTIANQTRVGTENGTGLPLVSGVTNYPGGYTDTKGFLSWNNRLQDNYYYQEYSYEIESDQFLKTYKSIVKNILHPTGTELFGRKNIFNTANSIVTIGAITDRGGDSVVLANTDQAIVETLSLTDTLNGGLLAESATAESLTSVDTPNATMITNTVPLSTESITPVDTTGGTLVSLTQTISESVTTADVTDSTYLGVGSVAESVITTDATNSTMVTGQPGEAIGESASQLDTVTATIVNGPWTGTGDYANTTFANSVSGAFDNVPIFFLDGYSESDFDDTPRLVLYNDSLGDGVASFDTDFSVGNTVNFEVTGQSNTTSFTIGKIASNSSFKVTTDILPPVNIAAVRKAT